MFREKLAINTCFDARLLLCTLDFRADVLARTRPAAQDLEPVFPKKPPYSPYADRHFPERVYWGDIHLHTS